MKMNMLLTRLLTLFCIIFFQNATQVIAQNKHLPNIQNSQWQDTDGNSINAHGAGMLYHKGIYYLYGEIKKGKTWLVPGQSWEDYRVPAGGISCYSSKDLQQWKYEGVALASTTGNNESDLDTSRVIERPKVIYNATTKQFVMWMHVDKNDYSYARVGVATSNKPTGPFMFIESTNPNGQQSRDMTVFKDDDGKAYLIYSSENNNTMQVCLLSLDYLKPTTTYKRIFVDERREAPAMFKHDDKYFLITSACTGWSANAAQYAVAANPLGDFKMIGNPCVGANADSTFGAQSTFVLPIKTEKNIYLFMADRWNKTDLPNSEYLWLPLNVNGEKVEIKHIEIE